MSKTSEEEATPLPRLRGKSSAHKYRINDLERYQIERDDLEKKVKTAKENIKEKKIDASALEEKFGSALLPESREPNLDGSQSTNNYLIISFGKLQNLERFLRLNSIKYTENCAGNCTIRVGHLSDDGGVKEVARFSTRQRKFLSMVSDTKLVRLEKSSEDHNSETPDLLFKCKLYANVYSVVNTIVVGSFELIFPSLENMGAGMLKKLKEGGVVKYLARVAMQLPEPQKSKERQRVVDMSSLESEDGDAARPNSKDVVTVEVHFAMFRPKEYVAKLLWFHDIEEKQMERGRALEEEMKRYHEDEMRRRTASNEEAIAHAEAKIADAESSIAEQGRELQNELASLEHRNREELESRERRFAADG